jgi:hypothetical protein
MTEYLGDLGWSVEERVTRVEVQLANNTAVTSSLQATLATVSDKINGRPPWAFVTILGLSTMANGALLTACVALATFKK